MPRLRILAATAAAAVTLAAAPIVTASPAQAAVWGCDTGVDSKNVNGVVQYRGWSKCWGNPPGKYYRNRSVFSILGTGQGDLGPYYGKWVTPGHKSASKWVAWPYWPNDRGLSTQTK